MSSPPVPPRNGSHLLRGLAWLAFAAIAARYLLAAPRWVLVRAVPDDALFYLVLARNGVAGAPSTFDGEVLVNGYHPLWFVLTHFLAVLTTDSAGLVRLALAAGLLAYAVATRVTLRTARGLGAEAGVPVLVAGAVLFLLPASWLVTEAPLAILCLAVFVHLLLTGVPGDGTPASPAEASGTAPQGAPEGTPGSPALLGAAALLAVLARLDTVFLVGPPLALMLKRRRADVVPLAVLGVGIAAYMAANLVVFGHAMPLSGALKGSFPVPVVPHFPYVAQFIRGAPPLIVALLFAAVALRRPVLGREADRLLLAMIAGLILFYVYEFFFQKDIQFGLYSWHFAPATGLMLLLLGALAARLPERVRRVAVPAAVVAMVALGLGDAWRKIGPGRPVDARLEAMAATGEWLAANTAPGARVGATDPGLVAWFSERPTLSLDGLINDAAYQDALAEHRLADYLAGRGVDYVVILSRGAANDVEVVRVPILGRRTLDQVPDTLVLPRSRLERFDPAGPIGVWRGPFEAAYRARRNAR